VQGGLSFTFRQGTKQWHRKSFHPALHARRKWRWTGNQFDVFDSEFPPVPASPDTHQPSGSTTGWQRWIAHAMTLQIRKQRNRDRGYVAMAAHFGGEAAPPASELALLRQSPRPGPASSSAVKRCKTRHRIRSRTFKS